MKTFDEAAMDVELAMGNEALTRGLPKGAILSLAGSDAVIRVWGFLVPG